MLSRRNLIGVPLVAAAGLASFPARAEGVRMVIELFTSQGCSSCPPADKLLTELAQKPDVLALSMPVDYWDYLGWKDTLASPLHTKRQKAYSVVRGDRQVYTPQAVINGLAHAVGSNHSAIEAAAIAARGRAGALSVSVKAREEGSAIKIAISPMAGAAPLSGRVVLLKLRKTCEVAIGRGENTGRTVTYVNVVQGFVPVGDWDGKEAVLTLPKAKAEGPHVDGWAVLVQGGTDYEPGAILGAAKGP